jgi:hypothetical protein
MTTWKYFSIFLYQQQSLQICERIYLPILSLDRTEKEDESFHWPIPHNTENLLKLYFKPRCDPNSLMQNQKHITSRLQADRLKMTRIVISILQQGLANYGPQAVVCWPAVLLYPGRQWWTNLLNQYSISYDVTANWRTELTLVFTLFNYVHRTLQRIRTFWTYSV